MKTNLKLGETILEWIPAIRRRELLQRGKEDHCNGEKIADFEIYTNLKCQTE